MLSASLNPTDTIDSMNPIDSTNLTNPKTILITVDLEDWFQVENLRPIFPIQQWDTCESRIESNTNIILDLFGFYNVKATFFVLGWLAERYPSLINEIHNKGHEIASHGYSHDSCYDLSKTELKKDLKRSKELIEEIINQRVLGYRAPNFSATEALIEVLAETGYQYDSSYNNIRFNKQHGQVKVPQNCSHKGFFLMPNGLIELPVTNLRWGRFTFPWAGGGYFRFWPSRLFRWGVERIIRTSGTPYVFYLHPWEIDFNQPRIQNIRQLNRIRHYLNLSRCLDRLRGFLSSSQDCQFMPCSTYLNFIT